MFIGSASQGPIAPLALTVVSILQVPEQPRHFWGLLEAGEGWSPARPHWGGLSRGACGGSAGTMHLGREVQIMLQDNTLSPLATPRVPFVTWPRRFWRVLRSL